NVKVFYTARDNRTVASIEELEKDRWLIERTIHPRDPWERPEDPPGRNIQFVRYLVTERDNWESNGYDSEAFKDYDMSMALKPGETLVRWWEPKLGKFEGRDKNALVPERYANGQLIWEPDLEKIDLLDYSMFEPWDNVTSRQRDGRGPAVHINKLQTSLYPRPARFAIPIRSPYPIVGGRFRCTLVKEGGSGSDMAQVNFGGPGWGAGENLYTFRWGKGEKDIELALDPKILSISPVYLYRMIILLKGNSKAEPPTQSGLERFKSVTDIQVSPHSLPALALGRNVVRYRDSSHGPGKKLRITHTWREKNGNHPPGAVTEAVSPRSGGAVKNLTPTLKWRRAVDKDPGDRVVDYQVMVSLRPDCRRPVSPTLYRSVGSESCEWRVPASFLNPGTAYYWRVCARDSQGNIGPWGEVFGFSTAAGAE
ncbi:MAG: hypothetical protein U9N45_05865, partial [Gemmatimonadota bacterium]|nr:hypothetical protein [Gemmatimonadota bacterium]